MCDAGNGGSLAVMPATPTVALKGARVREIRRGQDLMLADIAQRMGYSPDLVCKIENGFAPSLVAAWYLAQALGVPSESITVSGRPVPEPAPGRHPRVARVQMPAMSP